MLTLPFARSFPSAGAAVPERSVTRTLILGGARSGKSTEAEARLTLVSHAARPSALYVATGAPVRESGEDAEWAERVRRHQVRRPEGWQTVETSDVASVLREADRPVLIDCLTLWLTSAMDDAGAWDDEVWHATGEPALAVRVGELVDAWQAARVPVIAVSNEVGLGIVPETASVRRFRDEQGRLNQRIAAVSDSVVLMVAGIALQVR